MERSSYFIKNKAMFGSFPTQEAVNELESHGVNFFINLTYDHEKNITPYTTKYTYINFPITDRRVPTDWRSFSYFLIKISNIIKNLKTGELIYIHCKGGHGRSGIVVACLLCYIFKISPEQALKHTTESHSKRIVMRDKWRKLGSPQTYQQKNFVYKFFEPIYFYRAYMSGYTAGLSNFTKHPVEIDGIEYPTAEAALQASKNIKDTEYVTKQHNARTPIISKNIGKKIKVTEEWKNKCDDIIFKIIKSKFDRYYDIKDNILNTGLRPIVFHTNSDNFLGDGGDGSGQNKLGKALMKLREFYYCKK